MTTTIRFVVCALASAAAFAAARAADGPPAAGKVLVLDNERTLEGDIERVGDQYRVRRPVGETWVPGSKVLRLCASREDALGYLRSRANLDDPDERLRLAHWCQMNGLREQALAEVTEAVRLRPGHAPSRRLLSGLQRAAQTPPAAPAAACKPDDAPSLAVEVNGEALSLFATRVQPILMNACASCHATGRGGSFQLTRAPAEGTPGRKSLQQNLAAVLAQVNAEQPLSSPLLSRAVSVHGTPGAMAQAPLRDRQAPAFRALEDWVQRARPHAAAPEPHPVPPVVVSDAKPSPKAEVVPDESAPAAAAPQAPSSSDPFDPTAFNKQMHPDKVPGPR